MNADYVMISYDPDHYYFLKQLKKVTKLGWSLERMLIVDDSPEKCRKNYGNAIYALPFEGDADDNELELLSHYLASLSSIKNVRKIEKRFWREQTVDRMDAK